MPIRAASMRKPKQPPEHKPSGPSVPIHSMDLLDTLHQGESVITTPEKERMISLLRKVKGSSSG